MHAKAKRGFTIVEMMVVVAIIGLLASVSIAVLSVARAKSRDAKRVSDIQVIRAGLENYWLRNAAYPSEATAINVGSPTYAVLSASGFEEAPGTGEVYLIIPAGPREGEYYQYQSTVSTGYALRFTMERDSTFGPAGTYYAHSDGTPDTDSTSK